MSLITYIDKEAINIDPTIPAKNKCMADDLNEIKKIINNNTETLLLSLDNWDSETTYNQGQVITYKNKVYLKKTASSTTSEPDTDTTNWDVKDISYISNNIKSLPTYTKNGYRTANVSNLAEGVYSCSTGWLTLETNSNKTINPETPCMLVVSKNGSNIYINNFTRSNNYIYYYHYLQDYWERYDNVIIRLIAMSDTPPATCQIGDRYYNTSSNRVYYAKSNNTWDTQSGGQLADMEAVYVLYTNDGCELYVAKEIIEEGSVVGRILVKASGAGGGDEISIGTTQPSDDEVLWINPNETTNQAKYLDGNTWKELTIKALDSMPIGSIILFAGSTIPTGWLKCEGQSLVRTEYSELFDVINTIYGYGSGNETFQVPNLKGRVPVGRDSTQTEFNSLGEKGGSKELQAHTHKQTANETYSKQTQFNNIDANYGLSNGGAYGDRVVGGTNQSNVVGVSTQSTGTGNSGNLQPYIVVNYIIKAKNTTPTMASIVDSYSTSTQDGYSCNYVNDNLQPLVNYSTIEQKTGKKWIDNKDIYQKTIVYNNSQGMPSGDNAINHGISNIGSYRAVVRQSYIYNGDTYCGTGASSYAQVISIENSVIYVALSSNFNRTFKEIYITIEYTKSS